MFGAGASDAVADLLESAAIEFIGSAYTEVEHNCLIVDPGGRSIHVDRVVSLPRLEGMAIRGVPADADGFIPVDTYGRVAGLQGVYAAGDGTAFPIKQGGLATQQADAVAETIAKAAGARSSRSRSSPCCAACSSPAATTASCARAWRAARASPTSRPTPCGGRRPRSSSRYLAPFLFGRDEVATIERLRGDHLAVEADSPRPETCRTPGSPCHDPRARSQARSSSASSVGPLARRARPGPHARADPSDAADPRRGAARRGAVARDGARRPRRRSSGWHVHSGGVLAESRAVACNSVPAASSRSPTPSALAIVVGSSHRGPVGRIVPGSVGERLLHGAPCPVAVAPRGYSGEAFAGIQRIGVG